MNTNNFVTMKLIDGTTLIAILKEQMNDEILIDMPFSVNNFPQIVNGKIDYHTDISPWLVHSNSREFVIKKSNVITSNPIHKLLIPTYINLIKQYHSEIDALIKENGDIEQVTSNEIEICDINIDNQTVH